MGEFDQAQNYERMIKKYQLLKNDNLKRLQEHPEEKEQVGRAIAKIDEEISSIQKVIENLKQKQLRDAKFRPLNRAPQAPNAPAEEKPPQEKRLKEVSHADFAKLEPPARNEFLRAAQSIKKETIEGTPRQPKDISGAHVHKDDPLHVQREPEKQTTAKGERIISLFDEEDEK